MATATKKKTAAKKTAKTKQAPKKKPSPEGIGGAGTAGLAIERITLDQLILDPSNVQEHSQRNIEAIKRSLSEFGQQKPIVVGEKNVIIAGNGTWQAAKELGWTEIAIVRSSLLPRQAMAFAIADNKTSDLSAFNFEGLSDQLKELSEYPDLLQATGFEDFEIEPIIGGEWNPEALVPESDSGGQESEEPEETVGEDGRHVVGFGDDQWLVIYDAIKKLRVSENMEDPSMISSSRALELICADYLGNP